MSRWNGEKPARATAKTFLRLALAAGERPSADVKAAAYRAGYSDGTVNRAMQEMRADGLLAVRIVGRCTTWRLVPHALV